MQPLSYAFRGIVSLVVLGIALYLVVIASVGIRAIVTL